MATFLPGFLLGLSLILAIGAQNAFVLRQGLTGVHVLTVVLACALSDAVLITLGVFGFARLTDWLPGIVPVMRYAGAAFVTFYGLRSLRAALGPDAALMPAERRVVPLGRTLAVALALTWLNPHVYLDTVLLLGSVSTQYEDRAAFAAGAVMASFVFFFSLGFGAALLRPVFATPRAWRALEAAIAAVMWAIAAKLLLME